MAYNRPREFVTKSNPHPIKGIMKLSASDESGVHTINSVLGEYNCRDAMRRYLVKMQHGWERSGLIGHVEYQITDWVPLPQPDPAVYGAVPQQTASKSLGPDLERPNFLEGYPSFLNAPDYL